MNNKNYRKEKKPRLSKKLEKKSKAKKKRKQESSRPTSPIEPDNIQPDTPPQTPTMPRGRRNDDDSDDEGTPHRNHYWSLRDIPKFEGKGEQPFSHLMEVEDYLVASGVRVEPEEVGGNMVQPDYRDIINKFKASLKNNARVWFSMYIEKRVPNLNSADGWKAVKSKFLTYFNPIGSTKEQQIKAWKELKWKPEEKLTDFVFRFSQHMSLVTQMNNRYHTLCCVYQEDCTYTKKVHKLPDAVENFRKGIALGGLDTFGSISRTVQDDSKPTVPFMVMKENRIQIYN